MICIRDRLHLMGRYHETVLGPMPEVHKHLLVILNLLKDFSSSMAGYAWLKGCPRGEDRHESGLNSLKVA